MGFPDASGGDAPTRLLRQKNQRIVFESYFIGPLPLSRAQRPTAGSDPAEAGNGRKKLKEKIPAFNRYG